MSKAPKTVAMITICTKCENVSSMPFEGGVVPECCDEMKLAWCNAAEVDWKVFAEIAGSPA